MAFGKKAAAAVIAVAPEVGPLGVFVDGVVKDVLTRALGPGDRVPLEIFFNYALFSLCICLCIFTASRIISPRLFKGAMSHLKPFEVKIWHTNMVTFLPTFAVTFFALPAILKYDADRYTFIAPASAETLKGTGMSLGYMTWDLLVLIFDAKDQMAAYGGVTPYVLFLFHHTFSIAAWPYAVSAGRCVYFVNYFLVSEVTNFNMSLRWYLTKTNREGGSLYFWNGILWIPLFFLVRVAVIPNLVDRYLNSDWSALGANETWAARLLLPVPVGRNLYWFGLIITTAVRFLITGSEGGHSEATEGARGRAKSRKKAD